MDIEAHWTAVYNEMRAALDNGGASAVPILHVTSIDTQTGQGTEAPFVVYRQDVERSFGTVGGGEQKVLRSGWVVTSYSEGLAEGLNYLSLIADALTDGIADTADGYVTAGVEIIGVQTLHEPDFMVYASHMRLLWERSL